MRLRLKYPAARIRVRLYLEPAYLSSGACMNKSPGMSQILTTGLCVKASLAAWFAPAVYFVEYLTSYNSVWQHFKTLGLETWSGGCGGGQVPTKPFLPVPENLRWGSSKLGGFYLSLLCFYAIRFPSRFWLTNTSPNFFGRRYLGHIQKWEMLGSTKDGVSSPKSSGHFEELRAYLCNKDTCAASGFLALSAVLLI